MVIIRASYARREANTGAGHRVARPEARDVACDHRVLDRKQIKLQTLAGVASLVPVATGVGSSLGEGQAGDPAA